MFHLFTLRDLEDIPGVATEVQEVHPSSMEVLEVVEDPLSLHWTQRSTLSTSSSITGGCSNRPSSTLSTPCSSSSTMGPRLDHRVLTRLTFSPGRRDPSSSLPSPINTRDIPAMVLLLDSRDTR